jgi:AmpE protein
MKLLVIVLCLFSERFLTHSSAHHRFHWFYGYAHAFQKQLSPYIAMSSPWFSLVLILSPLLFTAGFVLWMTSNWLFGLVGFLLNVVVFYYCIGPGNPFYPTRVSMTEDVNDEEIEAYLVKVNGQLFSVLFWYLVLGPFMALLYRLISLSQNLTGVNQPASWITNVLEWLPTRMTVLLYLLVGNFQAGLQYFSKKLFTSPEENQNLLAICGTEALSRNDSDSFIMPRAESLVEHAVILMLVIFAVYTLATSF